MSRPSQPSLTHVRRFRGLWALAVLALVLKLFGSTLCAADSQRYGTAADTERTAVVQTIAADSAGSEGSDGCLLGEGGACHCACAHAVPLPAVVSLGIAASLLPSNLPPASSGHQPARTATLLRPPIVA
jgi:hypothetical protein